MSLTSTPLASDSSDPQDIIKEQSAFLAFLATFDLARPVLSLSDLTDGTALYELLQVV